MRKQSHETDVTGVKIIASQQSRIEMRHHSGNQFPSNNIGSMRYLKIDHARWRIKPCVGCRQRSAQS